MDKAKILRLCNEIENALSDAWNSDVIEYGLAGRIVSFAQKIAAEITEPPKSNGDRIRQMTDDQLAKWLTDIIVTCSYDMPCKMCPLFECCSADMDFVEHWLKEEAKENEV